MYSPEKRVKRITQEVARLICPLSIPLQNIEIHKGRFPRGTNPASLEKGWKPYEPGSPWTMPGSDEYVFFRAAAVIPPEMAGRPVVVSCRTNKAGWNALKPQLLFYVDGQARQAFDTNHLMARLCDRADVGKSYNLQFTAFGGLNLVGRDVDEEPVRFFLDLAAFDEDVWGLYHDLNVPLTHSRYLNPDSAEWSLVMEVLNEACSLLDLRDPAGPEFHASVLQARQSLKKNLYSQPRGVVPASASCVGQTHIDVAWLWRYAHTREKTARTLATVLALLDEYPGFLFTMSQPQLFQFLKEDYPELYARVKERILEGRIEAEGGMWVESDTNLPSGESLVRQFLHGKRFMREEFGVDNRILWLPDVFGYSAALPQILKKSGIDYFMTSKLRNNELNKMPHNTFLWKGIDGSEVLTQLTSYNPSFYNGQAQDCEMLACWRDYKDKNLTDDILYTYGYGDGGGGPTREMVETIQRFEKGLPGGPTSRFSKARAFFDGLDKRVSGSKRLSVWRGELYYEFHRGTYTSMAKNKRSNRKAEFLMAAAEWASVLSSQLLGRAYPAAELDALWKVLLLNQFHDVLPGSSIKEVYDDTDLMYQDLFKRGEKTLAQAVEPIARQVSAPKGSLVVFNPLSWERETAVFFEAGEGQWALSSGVDSYPAQKCHDGHWVALVGKIPSRGWLALQVVPGKDAKEVKASPALLENDFVRVRLNHKGNITSLFDKAAGREALRSGEPGNRLLAYEDKPHGEDNWNLDSFYTEKSWDIPAGNVELVEQGPVRAVLQIKRAFMRSTILQYVILWRNSARIDFETVIDWKDKDICLKAEFPVDVNSDRVTYEIQYGHIQRSTHENTSWDQAKFEVCAHKWADLADNGFGLSLLNDCKYGHDALNGNLRLTLLRSTCYPNPEADKEVHRFTYAILPHAGDWRAAGTLRQAYDLNAPVVTARGGGGALPASLSFARVSAENVVLEVVKQAEDGDGLVLRLYEAWNQSGECQVKFFAPLEAAEECDLMENRIGAAAFQGDTLTFACKPFEIKTFRVKLKPAALP
jgi:alpha-mannosidase